MTAFTKTFPKLPELHYISHPILIAPDRPTPKHTLSLSNLDNQEFLRFNAHLIYLFEKAVCVEIVKLSLSKAMSAFYPFAGRIRVAPSSIESNDERKLEVECNGEGALFAEAYIDFSATDFLEFLSKPNASATKLVCKVDAPTFFDFPPLAFQVTKLKCGGMILCISGNHCIGDALGLSLFLNLWGKITANPNFVPLITPFHDRQLLNPRSPPKVTFTHPGFTTTTLKLLRKNDFSLIDFIWSQRLAATSITFNSSQILAIKRNMVPSVRCTTFEALACHTWKSWIKSLNLPDLLKVKFIFSVNIRNKVKPELPQGYYGNGIVLGCVEMTVKELTNQNLSHVVELVKNAKNSLHDDSIRSMIDLLEEKTVVPDLSNTFVISQSTELGLERLDFGSGEPIHFGPIGAGVYGFFSPVMSELGSIRVSVNLPRSAAKKYEFYMTENLDKSDVRKNTRTIHDGWSRDSKL